MKKQETQLMFPNQLYIISAAACGESVLEPRHSGVACGHLNQYLNHYTKCQPSEVFEVPTYFCHPAQDYVSSGIAEALAMVIFHLHIKPND